jgi:hypothetical protein
MKRSDDAAFRCLSDKQRLLLGELGRRRVRFIVIGGYAVRFYGRLRSARDLDLVVECTEDNLLEVQETLRALGARDTDHIVGHLGAGVRQLVRWHDSDLFSSALDWSYERLARDAVPVRIGDTETLVISRADLISTKCDANRIPKRGRKTSQDFDDVAYLTRHDDASV